MNWRNVLVAGAILAVGSNAISVSRAQTCARWIGGPPAPGFVGQVNASVRWDPDGPGPGAEVLVVAGDISVAYSTLVNKVAMFDGQTWLPLGSGLDGPVSALAVHNGELYIGGGFSIANGQPAGRVAKWTPAGWQALGVGIDDEFGSVNALASHAGSLYVGGEFASVNATPMANIARWDGAWHDVGGGSDAPVKSLLSFNGDLIVGGQFTTVGTTPAAGFARWNGTAWSAMGTASGIGNALLNFNGELHAGGWLLAAGNLERAVLRWDGLEWQPVGSWLGSGGEVKALAVHGGALHVSGGFSGLIDGSNIGGVAKRENNTWVSPWSEPVTGNDVYTIASFNGKLVIGGFFFGAGSAPIANLAMLDSTNGWVVESDGGFDYNIQDLAQYQGSLVVAGAFATSPSNAGPGIVRWNGATWSGFSGGFSTNGFLGQINTAVEYNGKLIVGGNFQNSAGNRLSEYDETFGWQSFFGGGANNVVDHLMIFNGHLVAAGNFTNIGGVPAARLAVYDGTTWAPIGAVGGTGFNGRVRQVGVHNGELIATGDFTAVDGVPILRIARFDGTAWQPMGTGFDRRGVSMVSIGTDLYVGGNFDVVNGQPMASLARWDGTTWHPVGGGLQDDVRELALYNGTLVVAGVFQSAGGLPIKYLARWDGSQWSGFGDGPDHWVTNVAVFGDELIIAGSFNSVDGAAAVRFARWTDAGRPQIAIQPQPATASCGGTVQLAVTPSSGYTGLSFQWKRNGAPIPTSANPTAASAQLVINPITAADAGIYSCVISNACGSVESDGVDIGLCAADVDCSGTLSVQDIFGFLNLWFAGSPQADFDGLNGVTVQDIFAFLNAWFAGC